MALRTSCPFFGGKGEGESSVNGAVGALIQWSIVEAYSFPSCTSGELILQRVTILRQKVGFGHKLKLTDFLLLALNYSNVS